tara:strand:- start:135 stop:311 length:177 start_codon:yes stop_codon:yes gene_type:complete
MSLKRYKVKNLEKLDPKKVWSIEELEALNETDRKQLIENSEGRGILLLNRHGQIYREF